MGLWKKITTGVQICIVQKLAVLTLRFTRRFMLLSVHVQYAVTSANTLCKDIQCFGSSP